MASYDVVGTGNGFEVIATRDGERIGRISFMIDDDLCNITNIYVNPSFRRNGVASTMMIVLFDHVMVKEHVDEFTVVLPRKDEALEAFLEKMEFVRDDSFEDYVSFKISSILDNDIIKKAEFDGRLTAVPLQEVRSPGLIKSLEEVLKRMRFVSDVKEFYSEYDQKCSMVELKDGSPIGYSVVKGLSDKKVMLSFIYIDPDHRPAAIQLVKATASAVAETHGIDCVVTTLPALDDGKKLLDKLIPEDKRTIEPVIGYRLFDFDEEEGY